MKLNIRIDEQTFAVEVGDLNSRPVRVLVDGETFEVWPEEALEQPTRPVMAPLGAAMPARPAGNMPVQPAAPAPAAAVSTGKSVLAPIPGVIVSVTAKVGDTISFGQELCVLEAMKMKNLIRANRAGTIATVHVAAGDSVKHSQILIDFSD